MIAVSFPNSALVRAPERLVLKGGRWTRLDIPVRFARFDHPRAGRCLVDTGYSARTTRGKRSLALRLYTALLRPRLTDQALPRPGERVDTILLTHLHADHVSALHDFPNARLYADGAAVDHFLAAGSLARVRHGVFRELLPDDLAGRIIRYETLAQVEAPHGLGPAADVFGDASVLAVPLPGHMRGHTGILWPGASPPLLYAADAEWLAAALLQDRPPGPPARFILHDVPAARETAARLRRFAGAGGQIVLCHDPGEVAQ